MKRHKIIFATVALYAHGASLICGSAKITTSVDRSSYLSRSIDMLLRLQTSARNRTNPPHEDNTTQPKYGTNAADIADRPHHLPATTKKLNDHPTAMEEDTLPTDIVSTSIPLPLVLRYKVDISHPSTLCYAI
jgi:hypothetical protein